MVKQVRLGILGFFLVKKILIVNAYKGGPRTNFSRGVASLFFSGDGVPKTHS